MSNYCKKCKYLMPRAIGCFCQLSSEEIKHPRFHKCNREFDDDGNVIFGVPVDLTVSNNEKQDITISAPEPEPEVQDMNWSERRLTRISDVWSYLFIHHYSKTQCGDLLTEGAIAELFRKIIYLVVKGGGWLKIEDNWVCIDDTFTLTDDEIKLLNMLIDDVERNKMFPEDQFRPNEENADKTENQD